MRAWNDIINAAITTTFRDCDAKQDACTSTHRNMLNKAVFRLLVLNKAVGTLPLASYRWAYCDRSQLEWGLWVVPGSQGSRLQQVPTRGWSKVCITRSRLESQQYLKTTQIIDTLTRFDCSNCIPIKLHRAKWRAVIDGSKSPRLEGRAKPGPASAIFTIVEVSSQGLPWINDWDSLD